MRRSMLFLPGNTPNIIVNGEILGADAVGVNCGHGPALYTNVVANMAAHATVPIVCKPNAGMPQILPDGSARYDMTPAEFAAQMLKIRTAGATLLGGCCGTTPEYIRALHKALQE